MHRAYGAQQPALRVADYKAVTRDLKIYQAPHTEEGRSAGTGSAAAQDSRYPQISRSWRG